MIRSKKGQAELVEYILTFLISTIVIIAIYALVMAIYNNQLAAEINNDLKQLNAQTLSSIIKLYTSASSYTDPIQNNNAILLGTINLNYPNNVARRNYEIILVSPGQIYSPLNITTSYGSGGQDMGGPKIIGRTLVKPFIEVITNIPSIDIVAQGQVSNGLNPTLSFYKANISGNVTNIAILGNYSILSNVNSIR